MLRPIQNPGPQCVVLGVAAVLSISRDSKPRTKRHAGISRAPEEEYRVELAHACCSNGLNLNNTHRAVIKSRRTIKGVGIGVVTVYPRSLSRQGQVLDTQRDNVRCISRGDGIWPILIHVKLDCKFIIV